MPDIDGEPRAALAALTAEYELDDDELDALEHGQCARLLEQLAEGYELYRLRVQAGTTPLASRDAVARRLGAAAGVLWSSHGRPGTPELELTFAAAAPELELLEILQGVDGQLLRVPRRAHLSRPPPAAAISIHPGVPSLASQRPPSLERARNVSLAPQAPPAPGVIPVEMHRLDRLMDAVGELGTVQSGIGSLLEKARSGAGQAELLCEAQRLQRSFERSVGALRACALDTRMVPVVALLDGLGHRARARAAGCEKAVQVGVEDNTVEIDKQLADELVEPLSQWLACVVESAIEDPAERVAAGKPALARVDLRARAASSQRIAIEIEDDGRGIDLGRVRELAVQRGFVTPAEAEALAPQQLLELVFAPGLMSDAFAARASAEGLANFYGALRRAGATVELTAGSCQGTCLRVTVPVTRALVLSLLVSTRGRTLALPLASVEEVSRRPPAPASAADEAERFELHGDPIELVDLGRWLGLPLQPGSAAGRHIVVVRHGARRLGLVVDRAVAQQPVLVKPLGPSLRAVRAVTGAADLGDGRLALVLDPAALFEDIALADPLLAARGST